jgi:hypothetical protein
LSTAARSAEGAEFSNIKVTVMSRIRSRRSFDPAALDALRSIPPAETLDRLGLVWKIDRDFRPQKDSRTVRLHVAVGAGVVELVVTGARWYDTRAQRGGGGAIDPRKRADLRVTAPVGAYPIVVVVSSR